VRLPSAEFWFPLCCALMVAMSLTGCHRPLLNNKNLEQAPTVDPSVYTVAEYNKDKAAYDTANDLNVAKLKRNDIVWGLMTDVEIVYNSRYHKLFSTKNLTAVVGDSVTLGLGAAGTIATNAATKTIFAALNTGFSGLNLSISKNYYAEQSFQVIGIAMQTRRDKIRAGIGAGLAQDVTAYPLNQAKRDLITYIQAGTLEAGLQELQEEAGVATAAIKATVPTTPPTTPSSPFTNVGITQNALTWSAVTGASSYTVYWANTAGVTKSSSKLDPVTVNDVVHAGLDSGKTYYYAISASNAVGESALSAEVSAKPIAAPTAASPGLPAPANIKVQMVSNAAVITFDAPTGAATFDVYKDKTSTATTGNRIFTGKSTNLYVDTAADASKSFYSVVAVDNAGTAGSQSAPAIQAAQATAPAVVPKSFTYQLH
jgi:hypothetical protein